MNTFAISEHERERKKIPTRSSLEKSDDLINKPPPTGSFLLHRKASCACGGECPTCRTKNENLPVSRPTDALEIEAEKVSDKVMRMSEKPLLSRKGRQSHSEKLSENISPVVQAKSENGISASSSQLNGEIVSSLGGGKNMSAETRLFMESRFGADFSGVKIHADEKAAKLNRKLNADAFTIGKDVFFNEGKYAPESDSGKRLLAHELTHTLQQGVSYTNTVLRKKDNKECPPKYTKAASFKGLVKLVEEAEKQLISCGYKTIEERIHIIRGLYYGTPWSMDYEGEKSLVRNLAFNLPYTGSTEPDDPRSCLDCSLFKALKQSAEVTDGKKSFDFGHAIIGMDARRSWRARNIDIPTQGGTGLDISTWLGDLGGGAGMLSIKRVSDPTRRATTVFGKSDFGAAVNLEGDIGAFLISRDTSSTSALGLDLSGVSSLAQALNNYLDSSAKGSEWNTRCQLFLTMLGGTFTGSKLANRSALEAKLISQIKDFGLWYMINRLRQSGKFSKKSALSASRHLIGASTEVTKIFLDIMTSCAAGTTTSLKPVSNPSPTPPGSPLSEVEGFFSAQEKAKEMLDNAEKWFDD